MNPPSKVEDVELLAFLWAQDAEVRLHSSRIAGDGDKVVNALRRRPGRATLLFTDSSVTALRARHAAPSAAIVFEGLAHAESRVLIDAGFRRFHYVRAPNGRIRWIFPAGHHCPLHLALYNAQTLRAALYKSVVRACFRSGHDALLTSGTFYCSFSIQELLSRFFGAGPGFRNAAIFTGTPGDDRKATIALSNDETEVPSHFLKIPIGRLAPKLILNEIAVLARLATAATGVTVPKAIAPSDSSGAVLLSNIGSTSTWSPRRFGRTHAGALRALYRPFLNRVKSSQLSLVSEAREALVKLERGSFASNGLNGALAQLVSELNRAALHLDFEREIPVALGHCDFTPWNMVLRDGSLGLYDWELARFDVPLLYDLFQFVIQSEVLVARRVDPLDAIRGALALPELRELLQTEAIDVNQHFTLYLLTQAARYALQFSAQNTIHEQAHWLIAAWRHCLDQVNRTNGHPL